MTIEFTERRQRIYKWLTLIVIDLPIGLIAGILLIVGSMGAFYNAFIETFAWGVIPFFSNFPCVVGGIALMIFSKFSRRIIWSIILVVVGITIIILGLGSGMLDSSIMDTTFEVGDIPRLVCPGIVMGIFIGIGYKVAIELLDSSQRDAPTLLSKNIGYWLELPLTNMFISGFLVGLTLFTFKDRLYFDSFDLAIGVISGSIIGFACSSLKFFHYIIARFVFRPSLGHVENP